MDLITIDFETYYADDYTLTKLTTEAYVRDPRFECILVGIKCNADPVSWMTPDAFARFTRSIDWANTAVLAHHAHFDMLILSHHSGIVPGLYLDTLSMARPLHGSEVGDSLRALAKHYEVGEKGAEVLLTRNKHRADFTPAEYQRYGQYCCNDVEIAYQIFWKMLDAGFPESELYHIDTTVRMFADPTLSVDQTALREVVLYEQERKTNLLERSGVDRGELLSNDKFAQVLFDLGEEPPTKISQRTGKEIWAFAKSDPGMQALLEHTRDEIRWLAEARIGVKSTINETRAGRLLALGQRGRVAAYYKYAGPHTFRWAGGDRLNFQNFERASAKDPSKGRLRKALRAPDGQLVVVADSSQIEARLTAWLAGHMTLVESFARKEDTYSRFASIVYGRTITKADVKERFIGKICRLGLGYGMGWVKLAQTFAAASTQFTEEDASTMGVDVQAFREYAPHMERVEKMPSRLAFDDRVIHCAVAKHLVDTFRREDRPIVDLWGKAEDALEQMLEDTAHYPWGPMTVLRHGILLPSGLVMRYPGLTRDDTGEFSYRGGHRGRECKKAYGGSITENVVQALARIVVADQMQAIRVKYGFQIVLMTHDELAVCAPDAQGEETLRRMLAEMRVPPTWAPGLPLDAEGGFAKSYGGAKQ